MLTTPTKTAVQTELFASKAPLEWAVINNGTLYTAQIPIDQNGVVVDGGIVAQSTQTLDNLMHTLMLRVLMQARFYKCLFMSQIEAILLNLIKSISTILRHRTLIVRQWLWRALPVKICWLSLWSMLQSQMTKFRPSIQNK